MNLDARAREERLTVIKRRRRGVRKRKTSFEGKSSSSKC